MFCPKCKCEYREGFYVCADCSSELIEKLPDEENSEKEYEYVELAVIAETNDMALIAMAKSILNSEGIKYYINDNIQNFIPGTIHFTEIRVPISDAAYAKELLKEIGL